MSIAANPPTSTGALRVLVPGAGSGLGRTIGAWYAAGRARVLCTDVDVTAGEAAAALSAPFDSLGLRSNQDFTPARETGVCWGGPDALVNDAEVGAGRSFERLELSNWLDPGHQPGGGGAARVPGPRAGDAPAGSGHVVNVASMAGLLHPAGLASNNVTKAGVTALSETSRTELALYGIAATVKNPGFFPTEFGDRLRSPHPAMAAATNRLIATSQGVGARHVRVLPHRDGRRARWFKRHVPALARRRLDAGCARLRPRIRQDAPAPSMSQQ